MMAVWLGILTSISPCPLATNIAAISYIGKQVKEARMVLLSGMLYICGRMLAYLALGILIITSILSVPKLSFLLQNNLNRILGPILILAGLFLLRIIKFGISGPGISEKIQKRSRTWGIWGAFFLGILFALSLCPISAALFFGSLIPLSLKHESRILLPLLYGIGTGLPVFIFAVLIAVGTRFIGKVFNKLTMIELWARRITGAIFILVGIYYSLIYIFGIDL
jgi:cytochrome c biogenesis protein CcdA